MSELLFESDLTQADQGVSGPYEDTNKTRVCRICLEEKNIQDFEMTTRSVKKVYRKNMCRPCNKNERLGEKSLLKDQMTIHCNHQKSQRQFVVCLC